MIFYHIKHIGDVMVSVLTLSVVDRGFQPRSGQTKGYKMLLLCWACSVNEQILVGFESG